MSMQHKQIWALVALVIIIVAAAAWYFNRAQDVFPVSSSDQPISWSVLPLPQDAASSTPRLTQQIADLGKMIGQGQYPDEDIQLGIANDYTLIGDGKGAYHAYERAIEASSSYALAYDNMGGLFARLHATSTATRAYAKAVALEPTQLLFQLSYLNYLAQTAPQAPATAAAFTSARATLGGDNANLLISEAAWLGAIGSTTAAIADWRTVEAQEPGSTASIETRIAQLKAQH